MTKPALRLLPLVLLAVLSLPAVARAQEGAAPTGAGSDAATGFGVGVHALLAGPFGPSVVYGAQNFHIEGIFAFADNGSSTLVAGGRFWWHLHQAAAADLSLGAGLGVVNLSDVGPMGEDETDIFLEGGAQIRFFPVPNVALSTALGVSIGAGDAEGFAITGQLTGAFGLSYFFQ